MDSPFALIVLFFMCNSGCDMVPPGTIFGSPNTPWTSIPTRQRPVIVRNEIIPKNAAIFDGKPLWETSTPLWCEASKADKYVENASQAVNFTLFEHHAFGMVIENLGPEISRLVVTQQPKYLPGSNRSFDLLDAMGHLSDSEIIVASRYDSILNDKMYVQPLQPCIHSLLYQHIIDLHTFNAASGHAATSADVQYETSGLPYEPFQPLQVVQRARARGVAMQVASSVAQRQSAGICKSHVHTCMGTETSASSIETPVIDTLMDIHLTITVAMFMPLMLGAVALAAGRVLALILDMTLASLGFALYVSLRGPPRAWVHAMAFAYRMSIRMFRSCARILTIASSIMTHPSFDSRSIMMVMIKIIALGYLPMITAVGSETPKLNMHDYFLPGVTRWNGVPYHDFRRVWWIALGAALGNISQEGWSLLQTARNQDLGSPGNPGTPNQTIQSQNRNQRLFGAILNYIEATSLIYRYVSATFANDGRGLFNYIYEEGHLPYTSEQRTALENEWTDATMSRVGITFTQDAVFKWAEYVDELGGKLNKSERDKRVKYLAGFPSSFDVMIVPERARGAVGSYTHPANYPAHHPQNGNAHPLAGQPDIMATARAFYSEWARMIDKGHIKAVPKGMAYEADPLTNSSRRHHGYQSTHSASSSDDDDGADESASQARRDQRVRFNKHKHRSFRRDKTPRSYRDYRHLDRQCLPPRSHARTAEREYEHSEPSDEDEHANMARARITKRTVCGICGGIGHAGSVDGMGSCLTARLGHRIDKSDLSKMTYPDGYNPPNFMYKPKPPDSRPRHHDSRPRPHDKSRPRHVRRADDEPHSKETLQNSDRDAGSNESDHDEHHANLAVSFESIQF